MNPRAATLALFIAMVSTYLVYSMIEDAELKAKMKYQEDVIVYVAAKDISEGETLKAAAITTKPIPKLFVEPSTLIAAKASQENQTQELLNGSIALIPIKKGEQITYSKITEPGVRSGLAPQVAPGKRAFAIPVREETGVSKLVRPGDRVDLIAVLDTGTGKNGKVARTILQDVVVLSAGKRITNNMHRVVEESGKTELVRVLSQDLTFSSITVEVDPAQAQTLAFILNSGDNSITISLRNNDDTERYNLTAVTQGDVFGRAPASNSGQSGGPRP